ncbi:MAG: tripartite tricarboxylate transporter substrate binding protein [Burkholderiales bacterium]
MTRTLLTAGAAAFAAFAAATVAAAYPDKPIRYIVPSAAGGGADSLARILAAELSKQLGQQVIVDNRPGASGTIGMEMLVNANPDGYTIGYGNTPLLAINHSLLASWPYEAGRNLQPVARLTNSQNLLAVTLSLPVKSVRELIDYAKSNPDKLSYASPGNGTTVHLSAELFKQMTGTRMVHVPYKAITVAHTEIIAGQVQVIFDNLTSITGLVKAGRLRGLGVTGTSRAGPFPDLPTIAEAGVPGYNVTVWTGVIVPLHVSPAIVARLNAEINKACLAPTLLEKFATFGNNCLGSTQAEFTDLIKKETVKWAEVVKRSGAKVD